MKKLFMGSLVLLLAGAVCCAGESPVKAKSVLIDVRTPKEFQAGYLAGAVNLPHTLIEKKIRTVVPDKKTEIYLYCRSGRRVGIAMKVLKKMGYEKLNDMGGFEEARRKLKLPVKTAPKAVR